ncbi:hypothetical protein BDN72DRAFT_896747 [Pluteus cervinus]|uniref:Uncharacterized protein n=1 Tax=Pluteus cervinus TaxID=181527 RepID=A0ACD3AWG1_9AGAR|nr:hypothetical protein BDN72DRAFT_896747 [Pluteus cervinus]
MDSPGTDSLHSSGLFNFIDNITKRLPSYSSCLVMFSASLSFLHKLFLRICLFDLPAAYLSAFQDQVLPSVASTPPTPPITSVSTQWSQLLEKHKRKWRTLNVISLVLLQLNIAILQFDGLASREVTRTTTVLSLWFSGAGLICGCIDLCCLPRIPDLYQRFCVNEGRSSFKFWNLWIIMALPAAFTIWSAIGLVGTIIVYGFVGGDSGDEAAAAARRSAVAIVLGLIGFAMMSYLPVLRVVMGNYWTSSQPRQAGDLAQVSSNAGSD